MRATKPAHQKSIYSHMIRGAAWGMAMRWGVRGIGLISTIILARLLAPADFGIVAMAMLAYGLLDTFFEIGLDLYLIRTPEVSRDEWDTAWTIRALQGILLALLLWGASPLAAEFFREPRVETVIRWLASVAILRGFMNIGIVKFRKDLDFASDFRFGIYARLAGFFITVSAAFILQTYWALVIGHVAGGLIQCVLSYLMHPYRPRFCLAQARPLLSFSISIMVISISRFLHLKLDAFVVGGIADSARLGQYTVASDFSDMVTGEAAGPINRALVPTYSKVIQDPSQFTPAYVYSIGTVTILCCALGVGFSSVAHDFVLIVLGAKWMATVPLIEWLAFYSLANALANTIGTGLPLIPGGERQAMKLGLVRLAIVAPPVIAAGHFWGVQAVAMAATSAAVVFVLLVIFTVVRALPVTTAQILGVLWRPLTAAAFMAWVVRSLELPNAPAAVGLAADVAAGAAAYGLALAALWALAGRPAGPERAVVQALAVWATGLIRR